MSIDGYTTLFPENGQKISCQDAKVALQAAYSCAVERRNQDQGVDVLLLAKICGKAKAVMAGSTGNWGLIDSTSGYIYLGSCTDRAGTLWSRNSNDAIGDTIRIGNQFFYKQLECDVAGALTRVISVIEERLK